VDRTWPTWLPRRRYVGSMAVWRFIIILAAVTGLACEPGEDLQVRFEAPIDVLPRDPLVNGVHTGNVRISATATGLAVYVAESLDGRVTRISGCPAACEIAEWSAGLGIPVRTAPVDFDADGDEDVVIADIGSLVSRNTDAGRVLWLERDAQGSMIPHTLVDGLDRVALAEPVDLDLDGDLDLLVGVYGHFTHGELLWYEHDPTGAFVRHVLDPRSGAIHGFADDADGDGDVDVLSVMAEEVEEINLWVHDGRRGFERRTIFASVNPCHGLSSLALVDLDQDDDRDLLVTTGDTFDRNCITRDNVHEHGLAWFESDGRGAYVRHPILATYAAYSANAADLDNDGDLDLTLSSHYDPLDRPDWVDDAPFRVLWNDGYQHFVAESLSSVTFPVVTSAIADLDRNGIMDIVLGTMELNTEPTGGSRMATLYGFAD